MSHAINQALSPFGIKPFKGDRAGGDYEDSALRLYKKLGDYGTNLLSGGYNGAGTTGDMFSNYGQTLSLLQNLAQGNQPYVMNTDLQNQLNQTLGATQLQQQQAIAKAKSLLAQQGHKPGDPIYEATIRNIGDQFSNTNQQNATNFRVQSRQNELANLGSLLGQYANTIGMGSGLMTGEAGNLNNMANKVQADRAAGNAAFMNTLGMAMGVPAVNSWLGGALKAPTQVSRTTQPKATGGTWVPENYDWKNM